MSGLSKLLAWLRCQFGGQCDLPRARPAQAWQRLAETKRLADAAKAEARHVRERATDTCEPDNVWVGTAFPPRGNRHAAVGPHTPRGTVRKQERPPS